MPYRNSPHQEIEILMSFDYLHLFGPDGKADDGKLLFETEHKKFIHVEEKRVSFETDDKIEAYFVESGF